MILSSRKEPMPRPVHLSLVAVLLAAAPAAQTVRAPGALPRYYGACPTAGSRALTGPSWDYSLAAPLPPAGSPAARLGGTGFSLRRLSAAGLKVPPGFTITTASCRETLQSDNKWPEGLDTQLRRSLTQL